MMRIFLHSPKEPSDFFLFPTCDLIEATLLELIGIIFLDDLLHVENPREFESCALGESHDQSRPVGRAERRAS